MKKLALTIISLFVTGWAMAQTHWSAISGTQYNMTVKGIIVIDGVTQANNQLEIGAFCGDECRGSRKAALFPPTGEYPVMLTVVSNVFSGETITFRIYDHTTQQELNLTSESTLVFEHNTNQGTMNNWFLFTFTSPASSAFRFTTAGNWSDASNWQGGVLPGVDDEVFIDAACQLDQNATVGALTVSDGQSLTLQAGKTLTVSDDLVNDEVSGLVIKDEAQLLNASENVKATMEKNIVAYSNTNPAGWYTIASPMDGMSIAGSDFLMERYDLYRFNEQSLDHNEWENYKAGHADFTTFENGRGYLYANSNSFSPAFKGTLNYANVNCPLTYTERPDAQSGFNLIGNPFPHVIYKGNGGAIDNANLASGYYTLSNEGAWHVHTYEDAILPGQGVLVKTIAAMDLTIAKSNAMASSETSGAKLGTGRMNISVEGGNGEDRAFVYFSQGIGLNKMGNLDESAPSLWIRDNGGNYAIAHLDSQSETIDLMFRNNQSGTFTLSVNSNDLDFSYLHLIDHITDADIDLLQQPSYTFSASGNEFDARFMLVVRQNTGIEENQRQSFCFVKDKMLYFNTETLGSQLKIVDVLGRTMKSIEMGETSCSVADLPLGLYLVYLDDGKNTLVQKILINN